MRESFIVGTTGRRHIVEGAREASAASTARLLAALEDAFGGVDGWETLTICTGLAVGADTIMARAVLAAREANPSTKLRLRAVLPMDPAEYERDFKGAELTEFRAILDAADETEILPTERDASGAVADRMAQYMKLRDYLLEESDLLVAYWSGFGRAARKPGGTVDVVMSYAETGSAERPARLAEICAPERLRIKASDGTKTYVDEETPEGRSFGEIAYTIFGAETDPAADARLRELLR